MDGNLSYDEILNHAAAHGAHGFEVPVSKHNGVASLLDPSNRVSKKVSFTDFLKVARKRFRGSQGGANPIIPNMADYANWIIYDRISFAAGSTIPQINRLLVQPIGTNSKTKVDTNLQTVGKLSDPEWMNCTGIGYYFNNNVTKPDLDAFLTSEYMEFWVGKKVYAEGPFQCFPSGVGVFGSASLGTMAAAATSFVNNFGTGWPVLGNMFDLRLPAGINLGKDPTTGANLASDGLIGVTWLQSQIAEIRLLADGGGATLIANNAVPVPGTGITVNAYIHGIISRGAQ